MRVLSIDWDYFMDATVEERLMLFPDGGNEELPEGVQSIIWGGRYVDPRLAKIGVSKAAVAKVKEVIRRGETRKTKFMIADSHKHIYDFVSEMQIPGDTLEIFNVDYHHDLYGNEERGVNCGNWVSHLMKRFGNKGRYVWIARADSDEMQYPGMETVIEDFSVLKGKEFDAVFICRSGMWSPPHLDGEFKKAFQWIIKSRHTIMQQGIFETRYSGQFRQYVRDNKKMMSGING